MKFKSKTMKCLLLSFFLIFFCIRGNSQDQQEMVTGTILDKNGHAMAGVDLTLKGTDIKVTTDANGNYALPADKKDILIVSKPSSENEEFKISKSKTINLILTEDGFRTRYWCCTSHEEIPHCDLKKNILKETHTEEESYTRY